MTISPPGKAIRTGVRQGIAALLVLAGLGCSDDLGPKSPEAHVAGSSSSSRTLLSVSGTEVEESAMRDALRRLTRSVALALRDDSVRLAVRMAMSASRHHEGKVSVSDVLAAGRPLRQAVAAVDAREGRTTVQLVDSILALELYLPVPDHRRQWSGDGRFLVASQLPDGQEILGCLPDGRCELLSRAAPPTVPTIVLVAAESDLEGSSDADVGFAECVPDEEGGGCGGGDGGGTGGDPIVWPAPGIYMTYSHLDDIGEDWTRGDPEIEVFLIGRT